MTEASPGADPVPTGSVSTKSAPAESTSTGPVPTAPLHLLCFGSGAIGSYLGGSLALAGCRVVFVERPVVAAAVREVGISIEMGGLRRRIAQPEVAESIAQALAAGPFDAAILAVKSFDTAGVLAELEPYRDVMPPVISFQNGVENEPLLASRLGADRVIAGTVTTAIGRPGPGAIVVERLRGTGLAMTHPASAILLAAMNRAGLHARGFTDPAAMKWSKLLTNLLANASSAILDLTPAQIFSHPALFEMEIRQLREALRVMRAQRIPVVDLPSTPVRLLAWAAWRLPPAISRPLLARAVGGGRGGKMPSFHIDLYAGRGRSEVDYLNGAVARFGERLNVATPVNRTLTTILMGLAAGEIPLDAYAHKPEALLVACRDARAPLSMEDQGQ